jgi:hypothetical protein
MQQVICKQDIFTAALERLDDGGSGLPQRCNEEAPDGPPWR